MNKEPWEFYRTKHKSECGYVYALAHTEELLPEELERLMGRKPGSSNKPRESKVASELLNALNFISVAATKDLQPYMMHVNLANSFAIISDGQITAGYPITEELNSIANYDLLIKAIKKCGKTLSITELYTGRLSIKGDNLRALVPCMPTEGYPAVVADPPIVPIDDRLKAAFAVCGALASEKAERVVEASVLLEAWQCTGTNGKAMMQYWHGIDLPPSLVIPKAFAQAVSKVKQPITAFGWTPETSITIYFEGGMWIKTLLYADKWPDISNLIGPPFQPHELPETFFEGVESVMSFNDNGWVVLGDNVIKSHESVEVGAQFEVKGLQAGKEFDGKELMQIAPFVKTMDFTSYQDRAFFSGENMRGVIMCIITGGQN